MDVEQDVIYANKETIERQQQANRPRKGYRPPGVGQETNDVFVENNPNQDEHYDNFEEDQKVVVDQRKGRFPANYGVKRPLPPEPQEEERYEPLCVSTVPQQAKASKVGYEVSSASQNPTKHGQLSSSSDSNPLRRNRGSSLGINNQQYDSEYDDVVKHVSAPPRKPKEKQATEKKMKDKQAECIELQDLKIDGIKHDAGSTTRTLNGRLPLFLGGTALLIALAALIIAVLLSVSVIKRGNCDCSLMQRNLQQQIDDLKRKQAIQPIQSSPIYRPTSSARIATPTTLFGARSTFAGMTSSSSSSPPSSSPPSPSSSSSSLSPATLIPANMTVRFNESFSVVAINSTAANFRP